MRNPVWSRDELILALDLYFRVSPTHTSDKHPDIVKLSETLNSLPIHPNVVRVESFRNANGVYMKLCNFLRFDPEYKGSGLKGGGRLEEKIWGEFASNRDALQNAANTIRAGASLVAPPVDEQEELEEKEQEFPEGRIITKLHARRERNPSLTKKKKDAVIAQSGALTCEVCGFDFAQAYGDLGKGFAECHHILPLSTLASPKKTKLSDLAIVCANCHRMLHRARPWKSIEELRDMLRAKDSLKVRRS